MRRAWALYKSMGCTMRAEFAAALRAAWAEAKAFAAKVKDLSKRCMLFVDDAGELVGLNPYGASDDEHRWLKRNKAAITVHISECMAAALARLKRRAG